MAASIAVSVTEKKEISKKINKTSTSLSTHVARLFLAPANGGGWQYTGKWGACCAVFERSEPKTCFIRMFDLNTYEVVFNMELYESMRYEKLKPYFHAFEADNVIVGLCFCTEEAANDFHAKIVKSIPAQSDRSRAQSQQSQPQSFFGKITGLFKPKSAALISGPTDFKHEQHIGYDPEKGFEVSNIPESWKKIFKKAGIKKEDLTNPETAKVIFDTLAQFGAVDPGSQQAASVPATPTGADSSSGVPSAPAAPDVPCAPPPPDIPSAPDAPSYTPSAAPSAPPSRPSVSQQTRPAATSNASLLSDIRSGAKSGLRKVEPRQALPDVDKMNDKEQTSLLGALQSAMVNRRQLIASDDDEEKDKKSDDDWD